MSHTAEQPELVEIQAVPKPVQYLRNMWQHRDFVAALPQEQLSAQHQTTLLGNLWHLMNPLLSVLVYYIIFAVLLNASRGTDNYIGFLMIGIFSFTFTTKNFIDGARTLVVNSGLMRSLRFPRALLPLSAVLSNLMTFGFELIILALVALATGEGISLRWLALPLVVALHSMFNLGGAFVTARLSDSFRDMQQLIPFIMRLAMYASGVLFDIREYAVGKPKWAQIMVDWNPLIEIPEMYRWVFLGSDVNTSGVIRFCVITVVLLIFGFRFFIGAEARYGRG